MRMETGFCCQLRHKPTGCSVCKNTLQKPQSSDNAWRRNEPSATASPESRTRFLRLFWKRLVARRDSWVVELFHPIVSPGDQPLTKIVSTLVWDCSFTCWKPKKFKMWHWPFKELWLFVIIFYFILFQSSSKWCRRKKGPEKNIHLMLRWMPNLYVKKVKLILCPCTDHSMDEATAIQSWFKSQVARRNCLQP